MKTYAAYYDNNIRYKSSSGGLFSLIASGFDVVYGVAMTTDCYGAEYTRMEDNISPLRGSKYIQAAVGDTFKQVKQDLLDGKKVLFSGTGCHINGLWMFLGKEYPNLFLLDVICHGVPSPTLWKEYVLFREKKIGKLKRVNFRCKDKGWKEFGIKMNRKYLPVSMDPYMLMFLQNYSLRPSCYNCHVNNYKKSDIGLADFWGIENVANELDDGKGTSAVFVRTDKGQMLFDSIKDQLHWQEVTYESAVAMNPCEYESVKRPAQRDTFFKDLYSMPYIDFEKKYIPELHIPLMQRIKNKLLKLIG